MKDIDTCIERNSIISLGIIFECFIEALFNYNLKDNIKRAITPRLAYRHIFSFQMCVHQH